MFYNFCWLLFCFIFIAISTIICTKNNTTTKSADKSPGKSGSTNKSTYSTYKSQNESDNNRSRRPNTPVTTTPTGPTTTTRSLTPEKKKKPTPAKKQYGKANPSATAEDEFKFPSLKESVISEHTDLDELDDEPNPLMDPIIQEKLRKRWAKKEKTQETQDDKTIGKKKSAVKGKPRKSQAQGYLPTVPEPRCPSVYVK